MKKNKFIFVLLLLVSICVVAFGSTFLYVKLNNEDVNSNSIVVMTSCNPVYIATLNVVGDTSGITVENLSQPTTGCLHDYTLTTEDMKRLSEADALVVNGDGMEGYLEDVIAAYPELTIIDATANEECLPEEGSVLRDLMAENSHTWLSSEMYSYEVDAISEGLSKIMPQNADSFSKNARTYNETIENSLSDLKSQIEEKLSGENLVILHEAYEYVAADFDMEVLDCMDLDEERQVSAGEVASFVNTIKENSISVVFAEYDYGASMGALIEEQTDAKVVYLNTLIHGSYDKDSYGTVMAENYEKILEALN